MSINILCKVQLFILVSLLISSITFAQEHIFKEANNYYKNKQYKDAIHLYKHLLSQSPRELSLWYNLGNAYAKLYKSNPATTNLYLANSIYHYLLAKEIAYYDKDVDYNLKHLNQFLRDKVDLEDNLSLGDFKKALLALRHWFLLGTAILLLLFVILVGSYLVYKPNQKLKIISLTLGGVLAFFLLTHLVVNNLNTKTTGVIFALELNVYNEPNNEVEPIFKLHEGTQIRIQSQTEPGWLQIYSPNGLLGWIEKRYCRIVKL